MRKEKKRKQKWQSSERTRDSTDQAASSPIDKGPYLLPETRILSFESTSFEKEGSNHWHYISLCESFVEEKGGPTTGVAEVRDTSERMAWRRRSRRMDKGAQRGGYITDILVS